jgi:drug/metabolite transporter (DMT)-like permease
MVLARKYGIGFWVLVPFIIAHQYLFLAVYTKAGNFTLTWFSVVALTSLTALVVGHLVFREAVSWVNYAGIALIAAGVALTKV